MEETHHETVGKEDHLDVCGHSTCVSSVLDACPDTFEEIVPDNTTQARKQQSDQAYFRATIHLSFGFG